MQDKAYVLGIDTSNYKTSAALVSIDGSIRADSRKLLNVKKGERGLRQSEALFQHVENLPGVLENVYAELEKQRAADPAAHIAAVCVSTRPRPVPGSYMPCFNAGRTVAQSIAGALNVPCFETSHQEGHIAAIAGSVASAAASANGLPQEFLSLHLSGGTCELLSVSERLQEKGAYDIEIVGGSKDISFGQVIDRVGVTLGMEFPAGEYMDEIAVKEAAVRGRSSRYEPCLTGVKVSDAFFNLSGLETQAQLVAEKITQRLIDTEDVSEHADNSAIILELFDRIVTCIEKMTVQGIGKTGLKTVLFAGGVSSSRYISKRLIDFADDRGYYFIFGDQKLSSDNAVGVARIGARLLQR